MVRRVSTLLALALAAGTARSEAPGAPLEIRADAIAEDVAILASPALRGRAAGSPEADLVARLLAQRFRALGLETQRQPVPLERVAYSGLALVAGDDLRCDAAAETGSVPDRGRAPLVFAGWGIVAPDRAHDDYAGLDVRGKTVLVWAGEPRRPDGRSAFAEGRMSRHAIGSTKLAAAVERGAAVVVVATPSETFGARLPELRRPRLVTADAAQRPALALVASDCAEKLLRRAGLDPAALAKEAVAGRPVGRALADLQAGVDFAAQERETVTEHNVLGLLPGSDPALAGAPIVVSAHYDHLGTEGDAIFAGADDNASGVAGLLEIARVLAGGPRLARPVLFASFAAEEAGTLGSSYLAAHPVPDGARPAAVVNLDMIGRDALDKPENANVVMASFTARATGWMDGFPALAKPLGLDVRRLPYLRPPGRSDDTPFAERGIPAVMLFTGSHRDYNTPRDLPERVRADKAARIAQFALALVRSLAATATPPAWDATLAAAPASDPWDRPY